jgi:TPR repeat protein
LCAAKANFRKCRPPNDTVESGLCYLIKESQRKDRGIFMKDADTMILAEKYKDYDFSADSDDPKFRETLEKAQNGDFQAMRQMIYYYLTHEESIKRDSEKAQYWHERYKENVPEDFRMALENYRRSEECRRTPEL